MTKQKPIITKSELLGRYYITNSYEMLEDGIILMNSKIDITDKLRSKGII